MSHASNITPEAAAVLTAAFNRRPGPEDCEAVGCPVCAKTTIANLKVALEQIVKEIGPQFGRSAEDSGSLNIAAYIARQALAKLPA